MRKQLAIAAMVAMVIALLSMFAFIFLVCFYFGSPTVKHQDTQKRKFFLCALMSSQPALAQSAHADKNRLKDMPTLCCFLTRDFSVAKRSAHNFARRGHRELAYKLNESRHLVFR